MNVSKTINILIEWRREKIHIKLCILDEQNNNELLSWQSYSTDVEYDCQWCSTYVEQGEVKGEKTVRKWIRNHACNMEGQRPGKFFICSRKHERKKLG